MTKEEIEVLNEAIEALKMMYRAWEALIPCLAKGVVQDYALVLNKAPRAAINAISKLEIMVEYRRNQLK